MMVTSASAQRVSPPPRPVVLTTDCGAEVDDQWALAHLALCPELDLKGIVTSHAPNLKPPAAESSARVAREVLDRLPLKARPPVIPGSSVPLADKAQARRNDGVEFLLAAARGRSTDDRLVIAIIGPATDVASALLVDPTLADRITIVAMGFDSWPEGKDPWNVKNDVRAWQVVLESRAPIVVGDAAVTRRHLLMTRPKAHALLDGHGEVGRFLTSLLVSWLDRNAELVTSVTGDKDAWPIWDEVVTAHLLGLSKTETRPRPALRDDLTFDHSRPKGTIGWVTAIDDDRLWRDLSGKIDGKRESTPDAPR
jgi:purine nucleosidase